MPTDQNHNSMGHPEPMDDEEGSDIITKIMAGLTIGLGGLLVFHYLLMPTRITGASYSSRLIREARQQEIQQAIGEQAKKPFVDAAAAVAARPSKRVPADSPADAKNHE
jgi:hypothetical protein